MRNLFDILINANGFDAAGLDSNRRGLLSQNQIYSSKIPPGDDLVEGRVQMTEGLAQKVLNPRLPSREKLFVAAKEKIGEAAFDIAADLALDAIFCASGTDTSQSNSSSDDDENEDHEENIFVQPGYEIGGIRFAVSNRRLRCFNRGSQISWLLSTAQQSFDQH